MYYVFVCCCFLTKVLQQKKSRDVSEVSEAIKTTQHSGLMNQVLSDYYLYCSISNDFEVDQNLKISDFFFLPPDSYMYIIGPCHSILQFS